MNKSSDLRIVENEKVIQKEHLENCVFIMRFSLAFLHIAQIGIHMYTLLLESMNLVEVLRMGGRNRLCYKMKNNVMRYEDHWIATLDLKMELGVVFR